MAKIHTKLLPNLSEEQTLRFWGNIQKVDGDGCWLWKLSTNNKGYGQVCLNKFS